MKNLLLSFLALIAAQPALSSDKFESEVICTKVSELPVADNGLLLIVQTNPTAWVKRIAVVQSGYIGSREIGSFQVALDEPKVSNPSFFNSIRVAIYEVEGLVLTMEVADQNGKQILGPGHALLTLPGNETLDVELSCRRLF